MSNVGHHGLTLGALWEHRNGTVYEIVAFSVCATNGSGEGERCIVYREPGQDGLCWHRSAKEFLDGRFTFVGADVAD